MSTPGFIIISQLFLLLAGGPLVVASGRASANFCPLGLTSNYATARMHFCSVLTCSRKHSVMCLLMYA